MFQRSTMVGSLTVVFLAGVLLTEALLPLSTPRAQGRFAQGKFAQGKFAQGKFAQGTYAPDQADDNNGPGEDWRGSARAQPGHRTRGELGADTDDQPSARPRMPPPRLEERPPPPDGGSWRWHSGHWTRVGGRWNWVSGQWIAGG